jgi:hypothetical protein
MIFKLWHMLLIVLSNQRLRVLIKKGLKKFNNNNNNINRPKSNNMSYKRGVKCWVCGKYSHVAKNCNNWLGQASKA